MITPRFRLYQGEDTLSIEIRAPYCSLRDVEVDTEKNTFIFSASPYYLRLNFPGELKELENSSYDSDNGIFTFTYVKLFAEIYPDLELINKFLVSKIEVRGENREDNISILASNDDEDVVNSNKYKYGFAMRGIIGFNRVIEEFRDVLKVDPRENDIEARKTLRSIDENKKFSRDHYFCDFIEDVEIRDVIKLVNPWTSLKTEEIIFLDSELDFLKDLKCCDYDLTPDEEKLCFNGLTDILFAYCYDRRTTEFAGTSESGWTVVELAATFGWLAGFDSVKETLVSCFRRSLIYPLHRNFELSLKVFEDLKRILRLGEVCIIKCLIEIYDIFLTGDCCRYILNDLFVRDYIQFVSRWSKTSWEAYLEELEKTVITKEDLGLGLRDIEEGRDICERMNSINLAQDDSDDDSEGDSYDSEEDSDADADTEDNEEDSDAEGISVSSENEFTSCTSDPESDSSSSSYGSSYASSDSD